MASLGVGGCERCWTCGQQSWHHGGADPGYGPFRERMTYVRRLRTARKLDVVESANGGDLGSTQGCGKSQEAQGVLRRGEYRPRGPGWRSLARTRIIRIINARAATRPERRLYEEGSVPRQRRTPPVLQAFGLSCWLYP